MAFTSLEKLLPRERALLGICGLAVLLAIGNQLVVQRLRAKVRDLSEEIKSAKVQVVGNDDILATKNDVQVQFDRIKDYVPPATVGKVTDAMSTEIEKMASKCGVRLMDRKPQETEKKGFFEKYSVRIEVEGEKESLMRLLSQLEASPQLLRVNRMELTKNAKGAAGTLKGTIVVTEMAPVGP